MTDIESHQTILQQIISRGEFRLKEQVEHQNIECVPHDYSSIFLVNLLKSF